MLGHRFGESLRILGTSIVLIPFKLTVHVGSIPIINIGVVTNFLRGKTSNNQNNC